jgi:uncharacterized protein
MAGARIQTIDTVRGVAVLGILPMNIIGFGFAGAAYLNPMYTGGDAPGNLLLWAIGSVVIDGKMRALFAMLFGASMLLMAQSNPPEMQTRRHVARMVVLFLFGMVHASLLWSGDILLPFALVGLLVFLLRNLPVRRLFLFGLVALALQASVSVSFGFQAIFAEAAVIANPSEATQAAWDGIRSATWTSAEDVAREEAAYRGSAAEILAIRHEAVLFARLFLLPFEFFLETTGLMLIGMALFRLDWWQGGFGSAHYRKVFACAVPAGWAIGAVLAFLFWRSGFAAATFFFVDSVRIMIGPAVAIGYAAAIIAAVKAGLFPLVSERLAAAGRMALSNYLMASILCNLVFTGLGFGLYNSLSRAQVLLVVLAIWALQLAWSKPWLARFRHGPFEWLWRSFSRWERQPMRKAA